jgi:hypothetical protein
MMVKGWTDGNEWNRTVQIAYPLSHLYTVFVRPKELPSPNELVACVETTRVCAVRLATTRDHQHHHTGYLLSQHKPVFYIRMFGDGNSLGRTTTVHSDGSICIILYVIACMFRTDLVRSFPML